MRLLLESLRIEVDDEATSAMDDRFLQGARDAIDCWARWWGPERRILVPAASEIKFRMIYPLAVHALNCAVVALELLDRLPWVAAGLARTAFEHALTAQWVLLTHEGEQQILLEFRNETHKRSSELYRGIGSPGDYAAMVGEKPEPSSWSVYEACARFADSPKLFYDIYRNLSSAAHPSSGTLLAYLKTDHQGNFRSLNQAGGAKLNDETPRALGAAAIWALDALEDLRQGRPNVAELTAVGDAAELPTCLRDSDRHPERQHPPI